ELRSRGISISCAHMRRRTDLRGLRRALRLASFQPDLVVTQGINAHIVGHVIARRVGAAHVTNEHAGPGSPTRLHQDALTRLVGGGPDADRLRQLAGDDRVVQLLGKRLDVPDIFSAADVGCLSSAAEGVPVSLLEAMALGKPVVATDVGGVAEAVEAEKTGVLVPVGDCDAFAAALLRLASNPA